MIETIYVPKSFPEEGTKIYAFFADGEGFIIIFASLFFLFFLQKVSFHSHAQQTNKKKKKNRR